MSTLVESILSIEQEASAVVAQAHEEAAAVAKRADTEIRAHRAAVSEETGKRIEEFRGQAEARHRLDVAQADEDFTKTAAAIDQVQRAVLQKQIDFIANTFRGL